MTLPKSILAILAGLACSTQLPAADALDATGDGIHKVEVTSSMIGFRDTLLFYVFDDAKAVLRVRIGNGNTMFPVSAQLHTFAENVTADGMRKWINNQHSDGLFIDAAEPQASHEIPAASCKVEAHELIGNVEESFGKFNRYSVTFAIKDVPLLGGAKLKDFKDKATVYVKSKGT